jgi:tRNA(Ile2) C34 agmatinyltransferase TiaS
MSHDHEEIRTVRTVLSVTCNRCGRTINVEGNQRIFCCPVCGADLPRYGPVIITEKKPKQTPASVETKSLNTYPTLRERIKKRAGI